MINPFIVKKYGALITSGMLTVIGFYVGLTFYRNFYIALGIMAVTLGVSILIGNAMLANPFRDILEGKGVLALNIDSTGVIRPFIMQVHPPYVEGKIDQNLAVDVFDREMVYNLAAPQLGGMIQQGIGKDGIVRLAVVLTEEEYNKGRFALYHFPVIIYNDQIKSIITKDFLAEQEKTVFAEHGVLYLNRKMEELTSAIRDFGRYVVEQLKPKSLNIPSWLIWVVLGVVVIVVLVLLGPKLLPALFGAAQSTGGAVGKAAGSISPLGK